MKQPNPKLSFEEFAEAMQWRIDRLRESGRLPSFERFAEALAKAAEAVERTEHEENENPSR